MRSLTLAFIALLITLPNAMAEPQRIEDPEPTCDNRADTELPPCDKNPVKSDRPARLPSEGDSVTVPPEIPAEGLPHQNKESPMDDGPLNSDKR
jgi:hypothetical protein